MKSVKLPSKKMHEINAGVIKRFFAFIVDLLVINLIIVGPFRAKIMSQIPEASFSATMDFLTNNPQVIDKMYSLFFIIFILIYIYFIIFDMKLGQTVGKMVLNVYSQNGVNKKAPITFSQAGVRNFGVIMFLLFFPAIMFDIAFMMFDKQGRRFLEKMSNTKTVEQINLKM